VLRHACLVNPEPTVSASWLLRLARYGLGTWLTIYGAIALVSPNDRIASANLDYIAAFLSTEPHYLLAWMFLIPGVLVLVPRTRTIGLIVATACLSIFVIALIASTIGGTGTFTAPVTFAFALAVSATLLGLRDVP